MSVAANEEINSTIAGAAGNSLSLIPATFEYLRRNSPKRSAFT